MATIKHILEVKGRHFWSIKPRATVLDALTVLAERKIGALLVMEGEQLLGIFSERDFARHAKERVEMSLAVPVEEVMTSNILCVKQATSVDDCMDLMTDRRIRHLPVMDGTRVVGVVSIGDVVKAIIEDRETEIKGMENAEVAHTLPT